LHFEEFSRLLQASPKIRNRDFQKGVLEHILHLSVYESDPERDVATSRNFFCLKPHDVDVTQEVKIWLLKMARDKSPQFDLAREVLGICSADRDLAQAFLTAAEESIEASAHQRLALSMRALELEWPTLASQFLKRQWSDPRWIAVCVANPQTRCNFLYLVASKVSTGLIDQEALLAFRRVFPAHFHVELLGFVWRFFPSSFGTCVGALKINAKEEWLDFMSALGPGEIDEIIGLNPVVFIRTRSALSEIRNKVQEVPTRFVRLKGRNMNDTGALSIKELREYRLMDMKPALDLIAAELDQKIGTRVERWNELVEALRKDYQQWLEVTRLHDRSASQGRTEVKSEGLFEWLIGSVCDEVSVNAQTLRELNGAMVACHYTPRKLPGYFI
jgi:hypothetical protein